MLRVYCSTYWANKAFDVSISAFDIESYIDENKTFRAFSCGFCNKNSKPSLYYLTDFNSDYDMFNTCLNDMMNSPLGTVYVHNLSKFDIFFLNKVLNNEFIASYKLRFYPTEYVRG